LNTKSLLGVVVCAQGRFDEAEPLLLDGYAGLEANPEGIPAVLAESAPREALERTAIPSTWIFSVVRAQDGGCSRYSSLYWVFET
jgi:hypothetical protein